MNSEANLERNSPDIVLMVVRFIFTRKNPEKKMNLFMVRQQEPCPTCKTEL